MRERERERLCLSVLFLLTLPHSEQVDTGTVLTRKPVVAFYNRGDVAIYHNRLFGSGALPCKVRSDLSRHACLIPEKRMRKQHGSRMKAHSEEHRGLLLENTELKSCFKSQPCVRLTREVSVGCPA